MKKYILIWLFGFSIITACSSDFSVTEEPTPPDSLTELIISELATFINNDATAGGTRNHYVEIYNGTDNDVDLSNYAIGYQASTDATTLQDWSFTSATNYLQLTGVLEKTNTYVIASPQADPTFVPSNITWGTTSTASAEASSPLQLSGNSAIALLKKDPAGLHTLNGEKYTIIDVFGSPNVERVEAATTSARNNFMWTIAGESNDTRNRTFFRKRTVIAPQTDWNLGKGTNPSNSEWIITENRSWDYTNIGLFTN